MIVVSATEHLDQLVVIDSIGPQQRLSGGKVGGQARLWSTRPSCSMGTFLALEWQGSRRTRSGGGDAQRAGSLAQAVRRRSDRPKPPKLEHEVLRHHDHRSVATLMPPPGARWLALGLDMESVQRLRDA